MNNARARRRLWLTVAWLAVVGLWLLTKFFPPNGKEHDGFALFVGRFHPLVLHLPIALILLVPLFDWLGRASSRSHLRPAGRFVLALATATALIAAFDGWLLARNGGYQGHLVLLHFWGGTWFATLCTLAITLAPPAANGPGDGTPPGSTAGRVAYAVAFWAALLVMVWTSHNGGSLSHGPTFLTDNMPVRLRRWLKLPLRQPLAANWERDEATAGKRSKEHAVKTVYLAKIQPIFDRSCVECHGAQKKKASLRLDSYAQLIKGGDGGPDVIPWDPANSELLRRVTLPPDDDDFMPNNDKNLLTDSEKESLKAWIAAGASDRQPLLTPSLK